MEFFEDEGNAGPEEESRGSKSSVSTGGCKIR